MTTSAAHRLAAATTCLALAALLATPARADARRARLDKGEILITQKKVRGSDLPESTVRAVANVPPAKVWAFIDKCNNYKRHMPRTKDSKELSRKGNVIVCRVTVDMPWPMDDLTSTTKAVHTIRPGYFQRKWSLIKGDYKTNRGSWTITPFDKEGKRSLVVYKMHAEPNIAIPNWIQRKASKSTLPDVINAVRKAVGHKARK